MIWWRPADEYRSRYLPWAANLPDEFEAKGYARQLTKRAFNVFVLKFEADNDRDHCRW